MGVVTAVDIKKTIVRGAPYTSVDLNLQTAADFQGRGILKGLNVVPISATSVRVFPGTFLTPRGVAVELLNIYTLAISASAVDPIFLYIHTPDEGDLSDVTIQIATATSIPSEAVVLAERTSSGRWYRRRSMSPNGLFGQVAGGLVGLKVNGPTSKTETIAIDFFEFDGNDDPSLMVFGQVTSSLGGRWFKQGGLLEPRHVVTGRKSIDVIVDAASWPTGANIEMISNRDVEFQSEQTGDGVTVTFTFPSGKVIVPGSNEILVFLDGLLQAQSDYTEATTGVTLGAIPASGVEVALVKIDPVYFRETFTGDNSTTIFRLALNAYTSRAKELMVFVNGLKQILGVHYNETDGETITFVTAPATSAAIIVIATRSASRAGGVSSVSATAPITVAGSGDLTIGFNLAAISATAVPPQIAVAGVKGVSTRLALEDHTHKVLYPLSALTPKGTTAGGSPGGGGPAFEVSPWDHQHPAEGGLVTTPDRTLEYNLHGSRRVDRIPVGAPILAAATIVPAGKVIMQGHRGYVLFGADSDNSLVEYDSGFRFNFNVPIDYDSDDIELLIRYGISRDPTVAGVGTVVVLAVQADADDVSILADDDVRVSMVGLADDTLKLAASGGGGDFQQSVLLPGTSLVAGQKIVFDLARNKGAAADNYKGHMYIFDYLWLYRG